MAMHTLEDAFVDEMRDALSAEKQAVRALRKMARKASNEELRECFELHMQQTEGQVERLEKLFELMERKPRAKQCEGISGILEEGKEIMDQKADPEVMDAMLIAVAQKMEHYEIAAYGTMREWAKQLDRKDAGRLIEQTLAEEKETDVKLSQLANTINQQAEVAE